MNNDPIALQIADALLRNNRQSIHIEAAAELRAQHNALENAESTRRSLLERIAALEATKNECGAGAMCCYQSAMLEKADTRIAELETQLEAVGAGGVSAREPLTDDQMREVLTDEAFAGETKSEKSKWAVHEKSMLIMIDFCRAIERAHGITATEGVQQ